MKTMSQEAKDGMNDVAQKILKEAIIKKKQSEDLLVAAKILEETAQRLIKELESIQVVSNTTSTL